MKDSSFVCFDFSYSTFSAFLVVLQTEKHTSGSHHRSWGYFKVFPYNCVTAHCLKYTKVKTEHHSSGLQRSASKSSSRLLLIPFLAFRVVLHYTETFLFKATRDALSHKTLETKALCFSKAHNQPETEQNPKSLCCQLFCTFAHHPRFYTLSFCCARLFPLPKSFGPHLTSTHPYPSSVIGWCFDK